MSEQHVIVSFKDRHERIRGIADQIDAYLKRQATIHYQSERTTRELHTLRGLCEQLRCDAENIKNGVDGSKGVREVTNEQI